MSADKKDIFISYGRADDEAFTKRLVEDLQARGFKTWWDRQSMPSRGLAFTQEVRDAIDAASRFLVIVGPDAIASAYVRSEWAHALLFAKPVVPVLRLGAYEAMPDELGQLHSPDFRESRPYNEALDELVRKLSEPLPRLGPLRGNVPGKPSPFISDQADLDALTVTVLPDVGTSTVVTAGQQTTVISGMGGIGKSVRAAAFARAPKTRLAFPDGVVWLTIGQAAAGTRPIRELAAALDEDPAPFVDEAAGNARLPKLLENKNCLIVLDDVWRVEDFETIQNALGPRCRLLITSRDSSLATARGVQLHDVQLLNMEQALVLLAAWSGQARETLPAEAHDVARQCDGLPLALAVCGARVRARMSWAVMRDALRNAELELLDHGNRSVMKSLKVSVDALDPAHATLYAQLTVFPRPAVVPENAVVTLWTHSGGLSELGARSLLADLENKALLRLDGEEAQHTVSLHDLQRDYLRRLPNNDVVSLNALLVNAYRRKSPDGWPSGPNDGYFFEHLAHHLVGAGLTTELLDLLCAAPLWMRAKSLAVADPLSVVNDSELAWDALAATAGADRASVFAGLQAVRQVSSASSDRSDLEIEIMTKLGRQAQARRSVRGRADLEARFEGLLTIDAALRQSGRSDATVAEEMESVARRMSDPRTMARSLARLCAHVQANDGERSRSLLDEVLALETALENASQQIDVMEPLAPVLRAFGDQRLDAVLEHLERSARELPVPRDQAQALGRLALILKSVSRDAHAETLLKEVGELAVRLTSEGDVGLIADLGLHGIRVPGDETHANFDPLDALWRRALELAAAGDTGAEEAIGKLPGAPQRDMTRAVLSDSLVAAGAFDAAIGVATRIDGAGLRPPALRRIVKAMIEKGDARAEALFLKAEESTISEAPDKPAWCAALGALARALLNRELEQAAEILSDLWKEADAAGNAATDPLLALSLAKALVPLGDLRFQNLFDSVFREATAHSGGIQMVLDQMLLRSLVEGLLESGFVQQATNVLKYLVVPDQRAFALTAFAGRLADQGDLPAAESLLPDINFEDLGEAARIRVLAARAVRGDHEACAYFDGWSDRVRDLRRRYERENALSALAHGLCVLGRLREARGVIGSISQPQRREESLGRLANALAESGSVVDALRTLPPQQLDRFVRAVADMASLIDRSAAGQGVAALHEVTRIAGWTRSDWKSIHERLIRPRAFV